MVMQSYRDKIIAIIKEKWWYLFLLIISSFYVLHYRYEIYQLKELNACNLIFLIWLLLLLLPLFSEMEFLGVKIKKEVEEANKEVTNSLQNLQNQVNQIQLTNSVANNINVGNAPLPSEEKIEELLQMVRELQSTHSNTNTSFNKFSTPVSSNENVLLFQVRLNVEISLRELCEKIGCYERMPIPKMVQFLNRKEIINGITCDLIGQVVKISNRGVHGEIVSPQYISFVEESYPEIMRQLNSASSRLVRTQCPHCGYSGYSTSEHLCPQCGYFHDN